MARRCFSGCCSSPSAVLEVVDVRQRVAQRAAKHHLLVIAADRVKPRLVQPLQHLVGLRAAIHQITYRKQTILDRVKSNGFQCGLQLGETAVNISDRDISTDLVQGKANQLPGGWGVLTRR